MLLRLPSDSTYVVAYAAAAKVGAVTAGVNPRLAPPEQDAVAAVAGGALHARRRPTTSRRCAARGPSPPLDPTIRTAPWPSCSPPARPAQPKGALFRERQLAAITRIDVADAWGDPAAAPTPMLAGTQFAHVGFMTKLPWYLRLGTTTHILGRWRAADALACIAEHRIPSIGGVAPQIALLLREDLEAYDLDCVQTLDRRRRRVAAGARPGGRGPLRGRLLHPLLVHGERRLRHRHRLRRRRRRGLLHRRPSPRRHRGRHLRRRGRPAPRRRGGRGLAALPHLDGGVLARPTRRPPTRSSGWLRTGDLGLIDDRGLLRLAGRRKEMFIRGGYNVYPAEVERVLADHPAVAEVVVVPRPDEVMGELGVAVVVPADPAQPPDPRGRCAPSSSRGWPATSCPRRSASSTSSRSPRCRRSTAAAWPPTRAPRSADPAVSSSGG